MSKYLFIVESPNKCSKIKSYLGSDYDVLASVGHIREIPKKGTNIDVKGGTFEPVFQISDGKQDVVKKIKEAAKKASKIYLATDMDREGEAISFHIHDILDKESQKKCKRVAFTEITKKAILASLEKPRDIDYNLVDAQKARQVLDRLIGYKISGHLWFTAKINNSSAGRCQSPALKMICMRQREIDAFKPEDYWFLEAILKCKNGEFNAKVVTKDKDNKYTNEKVASEDLEKLKKASYKLDKIDKVEKQNNPPPPFDTNSLQISCSSIFGWSLSKSQVIAQKLYEMGLLTYIRSDSFNISQEALDEVRKFIKDNYDNKYLSPKPNVYTKKSSSSSQEAHECIRVTHVDNLGDDLDNDEKKMYQLVRDRFLACQMVPQIVSAVVYNVKASTNHDLIARGQTIKFDGWAKVYKYSKTKEEILPLAEEKESLDLKDINKTKHTTQPPARYNEASLSKMMEKEGIGRPSTRAGIISNLQKKGYVGKEPGKGKGLVASTLGLRICDYLQPNFKDFFMDIKYTSKLEEDLDLIADGKKTYLEVVKSVYELLQKYIKDAEGNEKTKPKEAKSMGTKCTVCGEGEIVEKSGQYGVFYSCDKYPSCKTVFTMNEDGSFKVKEKKVFKTSGKKCPECEKAGRKSELVERTNKSNGDKFYGCQSYPKCKYSEQLDGTSNAKKDFKKFSKPKKENVEPESSNNETPSNDNSGEEDLGF